MSRFASRIVTTLAVVAGATASIAASALPIDYTMGLIKGTFRFDSSGPGSGEYVHEVINTTGIFEDGLNEYLPIQPAGQQNASSTFIDNGVTMDWFEVVGNYASQSFSFLVRNFVENDPPPNTMGLRSYSNASFLLGMQVTFYDVDPDDPLDVDTEVVTMDDLDIPLLDGYGQPVTLNPGGWFMATYEISAIGGRDRNSLLANERIIESSFGEGFLLTATVPDVLFNPIGIDPDPDPTPVPEPGSLLLLGLALSGLGLVRGRRIRAPRSAA